MAKIAKMQTYIFFREGHWYPVDEENDEKVLKHVPLNPGTLKIETLDGRVIYERPSIQ